MKEVDQSIDFEIIWKKIHSQTTEQEEILLNHWLDVERSHRIYYESALDYYANGSKFINSQSELKKALKKIHRQTVHYAPHRNTRIAAVASIAASLLLLVYFQFSSPIPQESFVVEPIVQSIVHGSHKALLITSDGTEHDLATGIQSIIASDGTEIKNTGNQLQYISKNENANELRYNTLKVPRGGEYFLILSDSTKVWLNSETTLRFPVQFVGDIRRVELTGEAYFEVFENTSRPFVVSSGNQLVKVLGTQFNVSSYSDQPSIYTTLVEGKVEISLASDPGLKLILNPSEQGIVNTMDNEFQKIKVDVRSYVAWKDGRFVFEDQSLEEIMHTLSKWYDVQSVFSNEESKKLKFTGNLERYADFEEVLAKIEKTNEVSFKIENNTITIN